MASLGQRETPTGCTPDSFALAVLPSGMFSQSFYLLALKGQLKTHFNTQIHSFNTTLWSAYYVLGTILGTVTKKANQVSKNPF